MLALGILAVMAVLKLAPDTAIAKALSRLLVEAPARLLSRFSPTSLALAAILLAFSLFLVAYAKNEGAYLAAQGLPEGLAWIAAFDVGTWVDLIVMGWLLGAAVRVKHMREAIRVLRLRLAVRRSRVRARARGPAPRRQRRAPPPANDDEPDAARPGQAA